MRIPWVDNAKGLAIFVVVFCHVCIGLTRRGIDWHPELGQMFYYMGDSFAPQVFFFLSGLFVEHSLRKRGRREFILNKVETIAYPYVVFSLLQGSIEAALSRYTNMKITFSEVLSLFYIPRAQFWFLFTLFLCLVVIALVHSDRFRARHIGAGFALSVVVYLATVRWYDPLQVAFVTNNMVFVVAGMLYAHFADRRINRAAIAIVSLAAVAGNIWASAHPVRFEHRPTALFVALGCITAVAALSALVARTRFRGLETLGKFSMEIYVLHILACAACRMFLEQVLGIRDWGVHLVAGVTVGLAAPIVFYRLAMKCRLKYLFVCPIHFVEGKPGLAWKRER